MGHGLIRFQLQLRFLACDSWTVSEANAPTCIHYLRPPPASHTAGAGELGPVPSAGRGGGSGALALASGGPRALAHI